MPPFLSRDTHKRRLTLTQHLHNHLGELINIQPLPEREYDACANNDHRGQMHEISYEHAKSLVVEIHLGANITEYWEDTSAGKAGVLVNGRMLEGDLVVGADGVKVKLEIKSSLGGTYPLEI